MKELENWLEEKRLMRVEKFLKERGFNTFLVPDKDSAKDKILEIIPKEAVIGIGGSVTIRQIGIIEELEKRGYTIYHHWKEGLSLEEDLEIRKKELLSDVFLSSVNAVTLSGELVNIDGIGNRVSAQIFGPKQVIVVVGRNKVVINLETALWRIKNITAPLNAKRLNLNVPCADLGYCEEECKSPNKMCRVITILNAPPSRTPFFVILVNENLGF
ncbi:MAG: lactate utilization protein [Dictyoglomaceae bacterium]|nr:lactate utilization protein [Dictyoglomaceae bacterium]